MNWSLCVYTHAKRSHRLLKAPVVTMSEFSGLSKHQINPACTKSVRLSLDKLMWTLYERQRTQKQATHTSSSLSCALLHLYQIHHTMPATELTGSWRFDHRHGRTVTAGETACHTTNHVVADNSSHAVLSVQPFYCILLIVMTSSPSILRFISKYTPSPPPSFCCFSHSLLIVIH